MRVEKYLLLYKVSFILGTLAYHENILLHLEKKLQEKGCAHHYTYSWIPSDKPQLPVLLHNATMARVCDI